MQMVIDLATFKQTFQFKENGSGKNSISHKPHVRYKLFPFNANTSADVIVSLSRVAGGFLRALSNESKSNENFESIMNRLCSEIEKTNPSDIAFFRNMVEPLFFDSEKNLLPLNIATLKHVECNTSEEKIARFLCDILGEQTYFSNAIQEVVANYDYNVLEQFFADRLPQLGRKDFSDNRYQSVVFGLQKVFAEDLTYLLQDKEMTKTYLTDLLELYYFYYVSQACFELNKFFEGNQEAKVKLYYSLDWEKTSKSRDCYQYGWKKLQAELKTLFTHAVVLEMLNQNTNEERYNYVDIQRDLSSSPEKDLAYAKQVEAISTLYIECISDCKGKLQAISKSDNFQFKTESEIRYLFDCVLTQFENSVRDRANDAYTQKFEGFCKSKKLKNRKSAGLMLNITEHELIFLTKLSLKTKKLMRLTDVFHEFELRGVSLDDISKNAVMQYYEKLNLIEKKSDSGDAQYVKGIL